MKTRITVILTAIEIIPSLLASIKNSPQLNERVFCERDLFLNSQEFPVDVDMDGSNGLSLYIDYYAGSGTPIERLIYVRQKIN